MTTATETYQVPCPRDYCGGQIHLEPDTGELHCLACSRQFVLQHDRPLEVTHPVGGKALWDVAETVLRRNG